MDFDQQFTDGGLYRLPDDTRIQAQWEPPRAADEHGSWRFAYFASGEPAIEVFIGDLISQADPPHRADMGSLSFTSTRYTRSDLSIEDIRPA